MAGGCPGTAASVGLYTRLRWQSTRLYTQTEIATTATGRINLNRKGQYQKFADDVPSYVQNLIIYLLIKQVFLRQSKRWLAANRELG